MRYYLIHKPAVDMVESLNFCMHKKISEATTVANILQNARSSGIPLKELSVVSISDGKDYLTIMSYLVFQAIKTRRNSIS